MITRYLVAGLLAAGTTVAPLHAQNKRSEGVAATDPSDDAKAKEHYLRGERYYEEGDYDSAIREYSVAYELTKRPKLLFNMANSYERLGRYEEAIDALKRYAPSAPEYDHDVIARRISKLEERAEQSATARPNSGYQGGTAAALNNSEQGAPVLGWTLVGSGVAVLALGTATAFVAKGARDDAEEACGSERICPLSAKDDIDKDKNFSLISDISFGVGAAALLTGTILVLTHSDGEESMPVSASIHPDGFSFAVKGRF